MRDASFGGTTNGGVQAAIALLGTTRLVAWPPFGYGGIVASRPLTADEQRWFLAAARRCAGAAEAACRVVAFEHLPPLSGAVVVATTSVVAFSRGAPEQQLERHARRSIRRAERAGAVLHGPTPDPDRYLRLYRPVARTRGVEYPEPLLRALAAAGVARFYDVLLEGEVVSSMVALVGSDHWMYFGGAQDERGRAIAAGYLAALAMLEDAYAAGVHAVNLGASASRGQDLPGVAEFKRRLGGRDVPMAELRSRGPRAKALKAAGAILGRIRR